MQRWDGQGRTLSLKDAREAADTVLRLATVTNGELAYRSYKNMEEKVGLPLTDLAEADRNVRMSYKDLQAQPRRLLNSPMWSGLVAQRTHLRALHLQPGAHGALAGP